MGLAIEFYTANCRRTGERFPASWQVGVTQLGCVLLRGFGRKQDAEIAVRVLSETDINWNATEAELREQWDAHGGRKKLNELVCERLQW